MAEQSTFIKIDRNIERWRWWQNRNTLHVFLYLLIHASIEENEFENEKIHRGQTVASIGSIVKSTGLTIREIRTAISHLKKTGEVTSRSCNKYQVFTIINYDKYQDNGQAKRQTNRQASDKQATSKRQHYKNIKNVKNVKNNIPPKSPQGDNSPFGDLKRGTDEFRAKSHLLLKPDEGTMDDIPKRYREMFNNFADYCNWRNQ